MDKTVKVPTYEDGREVRHGDRVLVCEPGNPMASNERVFFVEEIKLVPNPETQWAVVLCRKDDSITVVTNGTTLANVRLEYAYLCAELLRTFGKRYYFNRLNGNFEGNHDLVQEFVGRFERIGSGR